VPTYAYACTVCDHRFEAQQSFTDSSLTVCPECAGRLRKIFPTVGVVFKGSGFYHNDSRSANHVRGNGAAAHGEHGSTGSGDSGDAPAASPAAQPAAAPSSSDGGKVGAASGASAPAPAKSAGAGTPSGAAKVGSSQAASS